MTGVTQAVLTRCLQKHSSLAGAALGTVGGGLHGALSGGLTGLAGGALYYLIQKLRGKDPDLGEAAGWGAGLGALGGGSLGAISGGVAGGLAGLTADRPPPPSGPLH